MNPLKGNECLVVGGPRKGEVLLQVYGDDLKHFDLYTRDGRFKLHEPLNVIFVGKTHLRDGKEFLVLSETSIDGIDINAEMDKLKEPLKPLSNFEESSDKG